MLRTGWKSPARARRRPDQNGAAMVTVMLAIFILTVVIAALALATMSETGLAFDQSRSGQAFHLAEAGAYRALAELRRRTAFDLDANIRAADPLVVQSQCTANRGWQIIAVYGGPGWTNEASNRRAVLTVGTPVAPILVRDGGGAAIGSFSATVYVRPAHNGTPPGVNACGVDPNSGTATYRMPFDHFVVATGVSRNTQRTICLKNPGNLANCGEWLASSNPESTAWDSPPAAHAWEILIEAVPSMPLPTQFTAPRYPRLNPDPLYDRSLWEELTGQ